MCCRYILVNTIEQIENRFGLPKQNIILAPNYNISTGMLAAVITCIKPKEVQYLVFGMTPFHAKKEMHLINARSEGESNRSDNPDFKGAKGIIQDKDFRKPIRSQRCLVLASAFVKGAQNEVYSKPFLFYMRKHKNPFAIAGIWDQWLNTANGETLNSFSIITTSANSLIQQAGFRRMPVILSDTEEKKWLHPETGLSQITHMLNQFDSKLMNAYPVDQRIKNVDENDKQLIKPIGERILKEEETTVFRHQSSQGYHHAAKSRLADEKKITLAERNEQSKIFGNV